jgi:hypothetical protein
MQIETLYIENQEKLLREKNYNEEALERKLGE